MAIGQNRFRSGTIHLDSILKRELGELRSWEQMRTAWFPLNPLSALRSHAQYVDRAADSLGLGIDFKLNERSGEIRQRLARSPWRSPYTSMIAPV